MIREFQQPQGHGKGHVHAILRVSLATHTELASDTAEFARPGKCQMDSLFRNVSGK